MGGRPRGDWSCGHGSEVLMSFIGLRALGLLRHVAKLHHRVLHLVPPRLALRDGTTHLCVMRDA